MTLHLQVLTPETTVYEGEVDAVRLTTTEGQLGVLPHHQPMLSSLDIGLMWIRVAGQEKVLSVMGGVFQTDGKKATVLADSAELGDGIDLLRAQEAKKRAESRLHAREQQIDTTRSELALKRALTRIRAKQG